MATEITNIIAEVDYKFKNAALKQGIAEVQRLDEVILKLKQDAIQLGIEGSAQFAKLQTKIVGLQKDRENLNDAINKGNAAFTGQTSALGKLTNSFGLAGQAAAKFGLVLGSVAVFNFIRNSIQAAAVLDKAAQSFKIFGLSAQQAFDVVEKLDSLSAKLPFDDVEVLEAGKQLLKFGISAGDVVEKVEQLSAISIGSGVSLSRLTEILGRANTTGKVFGRDFQEVFKNVPGLVEAIASGTGKSVDSIIKLGRAGKVTFADFQKGLNDVTSSTGKYGLALKSYQESFTGIQKEFKEALGDLSEETGKGILKGFGDLFKELIPVIKAAIPIFTVLGQVIGAIVTTIAQLAKGVKNAITTLGSDLEERLNRSGLTFGGRFIRKLTDADLFKKEIDGKGAIFGQLLEEAVTAPVKKVRELTEEELAKLIEARKKFNQQLKAFNNEISDILFGRDQEQLKNEGLTKLAEENKIIRDTQIRIEKLREGFLVVKQAAEAAGKAISQSVITQFQRAITDLAESANERITTLRRTLEIPVALQPRFVINQAALDANKIDENTKTIVTQFLETLFNPKDRKLVLTLPNIEISKSSGASFFEKLLGDFDDPQVQEQFQVFQDKALEAADIFINSQISKTDFLISETQSRIDKLLQIQEGGNTAQLELEQRRLDKLNEQKAKFVEQQKVFASIQIATANAVSVAESVQVAIKAFSSGGNVLTGIAASLAIAATIAATIAAIQGQINSVPGLWEGAERVSDTGRPQRRGRDGYLRWLDGKERVLNPGENDQIPSFVRNSQIPKLVQMGLTAGSISFDDKRLTTEQKETNKTLKQILKGQKKQSIVLKFTNNTEAVRLKRMR